MLNKKTSLFFLFLMVFSVTIVYAQIPNADFENWTNGEPDGWYTNNTPTISYTSVTQTSDAESGSSALEGQVALFAGFPLMPIVYTGSASHPGFTISQKYSSLKGYYKFNSSGGDSFIAEIGVFKNGNAIGGGSAALGAASSYTPFTVAIQYSGNDVPDSCQISFTISAPDSSNYTHIGSKMFVDNLSFGSVTGIAESNSRPKQFDLYQNYPNPFNPSTTIRYQVAKESFVTLRIYDQLGREVTTLVNKSQRPGIYNVNFDASEIASGVYYCRIIANNFTSVKKMLLLK